MYKNLPENIFLPQIEKEILRFWEENKTFEKSISSKAGKSPFTFYDGPPTANGIPGIHHVISRAIKDLVCRYKTMKGYQVYRKAGWDTQGLPVEVEVEKNLGIKSKAEIEKFGAVAFNNACKESVFIYQKEWEMLTERMGYWVDQKNPYITFHNEYIESVWWALKKFFEAGLLYKGFKILPFCPICESPLSTHEVAQGYEELKDPSAFVKFKITSGEFKDSDFLVWTTTPWTLPSNAALAVNPDFNYVKIKTEKNESLILAKERLSVIKDEYKIEKEIPGKELEMTEYERLFNFFKDEKKAFFVTLGDYVTIEDGTGIVHIAPAFGEDDYQIGQKYNLPFFQAVGNDGKFTDKTGLYKGKNFKEADPEIIQELKNSGRLYKKEMIVHSYPHCWRHHVPLMYYATDSWFIKTTQYKDKMIDLNKKINWSPESIGTGRFGNWLEENKDWALSRNRFWGTPLPIWYYTDGEGKEHYECIGSIDELKKRSVNFEKVYEANTKFDVHKPYIDDIIIKSEDGKQMKRVPQVIDCWFDSGSMPFAQHHYPFENREFFEKHYPADFIAEGLDQTRGWFYALHAIGVFLFNERAFKNIIVNGLILDKNGKKMSKSLGNAVNSMEMIDKYGADVLRWYLIYSSPVGNSKLFNENDLIEVQNKFFDTIINTVRFFILYSNLVRFEYSDKNIIKVKERDITDKWILSKMNSVKKQYFECMDSYDITRAARILYDFTIDELSNWYVRRNRKRFRNPKDETDLLSGYQTLYEVIVELLKMIAPVSPFMVDKIYMSLTESDKSIHLTEFTEVDEKAIDKKLEDEMKLAQDIVYLVRSIRVRNNLKTRQPLKQILIPVLNKGNIKKINSIRNIVLEEVNVKELNIIEGDSGIIIKSAKPNFKKIGPKFGKDVKTVQKIIGEFSSEEISKIETDGKLNISGFEILRDDIEIFTNDIEGWIVEIYNGLTVALDTKLDNGLIEEGIVREFINRVQTVRRNNNFEVRDKVKVYIKAHDEIYDAVFKNMDFIKSETLSDKIIKANGNEQKFFVSEINGKQLELYLQKS